MGRRRERAEPVPAGGGRPARSLLVVGATLALLGLLAALMLWSSSGSEPLVAGAEQDPDDLPDVTEPEEADEIEEGEALPTVTHEVYLTRDPFEPVRDPVPDTEDPDAVEPVAPEDPDDSTLVDPDDPNSVAPGDPDPVDPDDPDRHDPDPRCVGDQHERACNGLVVSVLEVREDNGVPVAEVQVDTTIYSPRQGEAFATWFRLFRFLDDGCVELEFGSQRFAMCAEGHTLK